ncbi:brain natriuretic peptide-like [Lepisosteus oculatus]|uniref:brain natriuretic peptide-like n=1 Tax=Lepisosteus oculatus TaxID=7918 RepID=UPI0037231192
MQVLTDLSFFYALLLLLNAQLCSAQPFHTDTVAKDVENLKTLLQRLEEAFPSPDEQEPFLSEQSEEGVFDDLPGEAQSEQPRDELHPKTTDLEKYLSARDLQTLRSAHSSSKRYSGCFGRRLDRIGSMSSLGCNTSSRYRSKRS